MEATPVRSEDDFVIYLEVRSRICEEVLEKFVDVHRQIL
jgi:hypothetical protein